LQDVAASFQETTRVLRLKGIIGRLIPAGNGQREYLMESCV